MSGRAYFHNRTVVAGEHRRLWEYLDAYIEMNGSAPTHREMAEALVCSRSKVGRLLAWLEAAGVITYTPGVSRGVKLLRRPGAH